MPVDARHPDYDRWAPTYEIMRDCEEGEVAIKDKTTSYLSKPEGFTKQWDGGATMYKGYITRAQFPDILQPTLAGMVGVIHRTEVQIEGLEEGKPLAGLWEKATKDGLTLESFHRTITREVLLTGRYEILTDVASDGDGLPYFVGYRAEQMINWSSDERSMFVLDETAKVQGESDEFSWDDKTQYRVLRLKDGKYSVQVYNKDLNPTDDVEPSVRGGKQIEEIPLVIVEPKSLSMDMEPPPLLGVAKSSLAIYRLDADYRHQLFNTGQETLFVIGGSTDDIPSIVGAGVIVGLPTGADAKYVGPSGTGIQAHRQAILDARQDAVAAGVKLFDSQKAAESGEALRLRSAAQTATLTTIALASAAALEKSLRYAAQFVGQDPDEIVVRPNLDFVETKMTPQEATQLMTLWQGGLLSAETVYSLLQRGDLASPERTWEEEQEIISQEAIDYPMDQATMSSRAQAAPFGGTPNPQAKKLNGSAKLLAPPQSRLIEDGSGLVFEKAQ